MTPGLFVLLGMFLAIPIAGCIIDAALSFLDRKIREWDGQEQKI